MISVRNKKLSMLIAPAFRSIHTDIIKGRHTEYILGGGRGSGKSSFASIETVLAVLRDENANAVALRKVEKTLRSSVFEQISWAMDALGVSPLFEKKVSLLEFERKDTHQKILLRGADDPGKIKSIKPAKGHFSLLWFEELTDFSSIDEIRSIRASVMRGGRCVSIATYNPPRSPGHWVNEEALLTGKDRLCHKSTYLDMPESWLGPSFINDAESLKMRDRRAYEHMYLGVPTGSDAQVFPNLIFRKITDDEINDLSHPRVGLDFGFANDPDALIVADYDAKRKTVMITGEYCRSHNSSIRLINEVKRLAGRLPVMCDTSEPRLISEMKQSGINAIAVKKGAGSVGSGVRFLQELDAIMIDPERTPTAYREFSAYEYPVSPSGNVLPALIDKNNHTIDALRYALNIEINSQHAHSFAREKIGL